MLAIKFKHRGEVKRVGKPLLTLNMQQLQMTVTYLFPELIEVPSYKLHYIDSDGETVLVRNRVSPYPTTPFLSLYATCTNLIKYSRLFQFTKYITDRIPFHFFLKKKKWKSTTGLTVGYYSLNKR